MSESLPYSGVEIVAGSRYAVVTQACRDSPLRSSPMVLMDVATMVWSSAAMNMPSMRPPRIVRISRWVGGTKVDGRAVPGDSVAVVLCWDIGPSRQTGGASCGWTDGDATGWRRHPQ